MECPVKGTEAVKSTGKTDIRHGQFRMGEQTHGVLGAEPLEIIAVGTAKLFLKNMGDMILAVPQGRSQLGQADILRKMPVQVTGNGLADLGGNFLLLRQWKL